MKDNIVRGVVASGVLAVAGLMGVGAWMDMHKPRPTGGPVKVNLDGSVTLGKTGDVSAEYNAKANTVDFHIVGTTATLITKVKCDTAKDYVADPEHSGLLPKVFEDFMSFGQLSIRNAYDGDMAHSDRQVSGNDAAITAVENKLNTGVDREIKKVVLSCK